MLKKRIIATLVIKDGIVVQSIGFENYLPIGKPEIAIDFLNSWGIDEIALIDISATKNGNKPNFDLVEKLSKKCFVPLAVGGGIKSIDDVRILTQSGADKVIVNNLAFQNPDLINEISCFFGSQCIICSVDLKKDFEDNLGVYDYTTKSLIKNTPEIFIKMLENKGAGEILLNFVDRDGSYKGFDIESVIKIIHELKVPIIVQGGAKDASSFIELFDKTSVEAAAASNFFHFSEHSVAVAKSILERWREQMRIETSFSYRDNEVDSKMRLLKKSDEILEQLLYVKIEKEAI